MRKSRLSKYKQDKLLELFVAGATARTAASLAGVNKTTAVTISIVCGSLSMPTANILRCLQGK